VHGSLTTLQPANCFCLCSKCSARESGRGGETARVGEGRTGKEKRRACHLIVANLLYVFPGHSFVHTLTLTDIRMLRHHICEIAEAPWQFVDRFIVSRFAHTGCDALRFRAALRGTARHGVTRHRIATHQVWMTFNTLLNKLRKYSFNFITEIDCQFICFLMHAKMKSNA